MPNIIEITDFDAPELDVYARLTENQLVNRKEPDKGMFIAESPQVIERALDAGCVPVSFLMETKHVEGKGRELISRCGDVPVFAAELSILEKLTGFKLTRGMLCAMYRPRLPDARELLRNSDKIAVLENVMNPTNIGAIFRSAAALNADAVLLTNEGSDPLYRRAIRVSMGTVFQVPWAYIDDLSLLHDYGFRTAALALCDNSLSLSDPALRGIDKLALILGTEGDGLSSSTISACDLTVKIPMSHGVDSLNVAAASAVAFWQLFNA